MNVNQLTVPLYISESPINHFKRLGSWDKNTAFKGKERLLLQQPGYIKRIKNMFNKTDFKFNMFFNNHPEAYSIHEIGATSLEWIEKNMPKSATDLKEFAKSQGKTDYNEWPFERDAINIIFNGNAGDERVLMTGWIIAHRLGHALARIDGKDSSDAYIAFRNILIQYSKVIIQDGYFDGIDFPDNEEQMFIRGNRRYQLYIRSFWQAIGTFRSARTKKLRNWFEMYNELIAQYLTTGKIEFNELPKTIKFGGLNKRIENPEDYLYYNNMLEGMVEDAQTSIEEILAEAIGKVFVM